MSQNDSQYDISLIKQTADYIRYLSLESIERAKSGHPGLPLGCAEVGALIYRYFLTYNPQKPTWINRDRFILSAGHGSMLLYSLLYLSGYAISLDDLGKFRQKNSKTPGHPEYDLDLGIETTTGPLGQGFSNAVGAAIEGKMLAQRFNDRQNNLDIINYTVYTLMGDGCIMEGISYEAASMAGHLGLDNLVAIYDSNHITIDGQTDITFSENVSQRFQAQGWLVDQANIMDLPSVLTKLETLEKQKGKPKLLVLTTIIGEGLNKKRNTNNIHGSPAGIDEIAYFINHSTMRHHFEEQYGKETVENLDTLAKIIKQRLENKSPLIENNVCKDFMMQGSVRGGNAWSKWVETMKTYESTCPTQYQELLSYLEFNLPAELENQLLDYRESKPNATRSIAGTILNLCAQSIPQMVGGTADLVGSTKATVKGSTYIKSNDFSGRNIAFGIREHSMGAIGNGLALGKILLPFTSTFFTFFDYMKPAVRLAALMKLNHLFIFSHDSIYVGEDGPTHQPIEHLNALRLIPGIYTFRPANDMETAFAFLYFLAEMDGPAAIITTRQELSPTVFQRPTGIDNQTLFEMFKQGGYIIYQTAGADKPGQYDMILAASGSETGTAIETAHLLEERDNKRVRVVSIPCMEILAGSEESYRLSLFGDNGTPVVFLEAASFRAVNLFFQQRVKLVDIQEFGISAPGEEVAQHFGFTPEGLYQELKKEWV